MEYDLRVDRRAAAGSAQSEKDIRRDRPRRLPVRISLKNFSSQIERGKAGLSVQTLIALCEILEITPNYAAAAGRRARAGGADWPFAEGHEPAAASGRGGDGAHFCAQLPPRGKGQAQGRAQKHAVNARRAVTRARAGSALAALALRAFAQNRARRFAARNDPVRFVRFAAMASPPRTALLPSRHGCAAPGPQRQNPGACRHSAPFRLRRNRAGRSSAPPFGFAAQNRARRFAARNDPVRFVRFAAMASPPRTALLPSPSRLRRAGSPTAKPRRLLPFGCISPAAKPRGRYFRTFARARL